MRTYQTMLQQAPDFFIHSGDTIYADGPLTAEPFWEFVSGPIHAGTFGPNELDNTFGPQLVYVKAPTKEQARNPPPSAGLQFFGHVAIDGATEVMTVTLKDVDDHALWSTTLEPRFA